MDMNETQDTLITVPDAQAATEPVAASPSPPPVTTTAAPVVPRPTSQAQLREVSIFLDFAFHLLLPTWNNSNAY